MRTLSLSNTHCSPKAMVLAAWGALGEVFLSHAADKPDMEALGRHNQGAIEEGGIRTEHSPGRLPGEEVKGTWHSQDGELKIL